MKSIYGPILVVGGIVCGAAAFLQPSLFPVNLAATGGALAGASLVAESRRDSDRKLREAAKVATAFQQSYARNKGVIHPEEISFFGEITLDRAVEFVEQLAEENSGRKVQTETGFVYVFPHPESTVEAITKNMQAWAESQIEGLKKENDQLKAAFTLMQQQQMQAAAQVPVQATRAVRPESKEDPWKSLL